MLKKRVNSTWIFELLLQIRNLEIDANK